MGGICGNHHFWDIIGLFMCLGDDEMNEIMMDEPIAYKWKWDSNLQWHYGEYLPTHGTPYWVVPLYEKRKFKPNGDFKKSFSDYVDQHYSWWSSTMRSILKTKFHELVTTIELEKFGNQLVTLKVYQQQGGSNEEAN